MTGVEGALLDFERPIVDLERKAAELRRLERPDVDFSREIERLERKAARLRRAVFAKLDAGQRLQLARHGGRPQAADVIAQVVDSPMPLAGDGVAGDEPSLSCSLGWIEGREIAALGWQRRVKRPGFDPAVALRKARRVLELAARFTLPVVTVIDQPRRPLAGEADATGDAATLEAARCLEALLALPTPTVAVVLGELCSVEGLALAATDRILMLEHAICAPAPAEVAAARLWDDPLKVAEATGATQLPASAALQQKRVDEVIAEPPGGAHRDRDASCEMIGVALKRALLDLGRRDEVARLAARRGRHGVREV
ncbi:MAG: acetyl-CoA carboxylase carboxyl transferase subunit alpha [Proteobacteria bacterium]|nr:MAG: acetyl-CoA carboxylase carboxyl transferase subunit alpha [Pseudomonadota bacterium]